MAVDFCWQSFYYVCVAKEINNDLQLLKTLSVPELSKLFSDVVLLGLTPVQIKEYDVIEQFKYILVVGDEWGYAEECKSLQEAKELVSDKLGISFNWYLDLKDNEDNTVIRGGYCHIDSAEFNNTSLKNYVESLIMAGLK